MLITLDHFIGILRGILYIILGSFLGVGVIDSLEKSVIVAFICFVIFVLQHELLDGQTLLKILWMVCTPYIYRVWITCDIFLQLQLDSAFGTMSCLTAFAGISTWFACGASLDISEYLFIMCGVAFYHASLYIPNEGIIEVLEQNSSAPNGS